MRFYVILLCIKVSVIAVCIPSDSHHKKAKPRRDDDYDDHLNVKAGQSQPKATKNEDKQYWFADGQADLADQLSKTHNTAQAKNIIYFLADGTSMTTLTAARLLKGYRSGLYERETTAWEAFPYTGIIKTYNTDNMVTDSAASSTAYLSGVKANQATIGVDVNVQYMDCVAMNNEAYHTQSILRDFQLDGKSTGIVTNTRVTHASPAGNYAHTADRHWENDDDVNDDDYNSEACDDIAEQLVQGETGSNIKVILGGGRRGFLPKEITDEDGEDGKRDDQKNLIEVWKTLHSIGSTAEYVGSREDLLSVNTSSTDYLLGLFDTSHMDYFVDYDGTEPTLEEMTQSALEILQKDSKGYFLFVEGGLIDRAHHLNEVNSGIEEALQFEKAVAKAIEMTSSEDTLIIVTADHGQPVAMNGYPARNSNVLGIADADVDGHDFTVLMYTNGPGWVNQKDDQRLDIDDKWQDPHYIAEATVPLDESNHNGEDVVIYASGPWSHLFTGIHENSYIPQALRYAACVGEGLHLCDT